MHSACRPAVVLGQRVLYVAVRAIGARLIPGERLPLSTPVAEDAWVRLASEWRAVFGDWDAIALYLRPQHGRHGFSLLLLRRGVGIGFIRVTVDPESVVREFSVMQVVHAAKPSSFVIAEPLAVGSVDGWGWLATASVPNYPLGAVRSSRTRERIAEEISAILDAGLPRPEGVPEVWRGAHGDLSPWNLRTELGGRARVIDWEEGGFAPAGSDSLYGSVTANLTFGTPLLGSTSRDAAEWVTTLVSARLNPDDHPRSINNRIMQLIASIPVE